MPSQKKSPNSTNSKNKPTSSPIDDRVAGDEAVNQKRTIIEWHAYERPFKPLNKEIYSTVSAGVFLFGVIIFFLEGLIPVLMLISLMFWWYVTGTVKPELTTNRLTTWGFENNKQLWVWDYMIRYWFEGKDTSRALVVEVTGSWPRFIKFVIDSPETEAELQEILSEILIEDQPQDNWLDKTSRWLETKVNWNVK